MSTFYVAGNLSHSGQEFKRGDTIDLDENAAASLIEAGTLKTEPIANTEAARVPEALSADAPQPEVAGKPMQTGEPSIDGRVDEQSGIDTAKDVTLGADAPQDGLRALSPDVRAGAPNAPQTGSEAPIEPTEDMKRDELEAMAVAEGISAEDAAAASNKAALVEMITARRNGAAALNGDPQTDPSVGL